VQQYRLAFRIVWAPIVLDAFIRLITLIGIYFSSEEAFEDFCEQTDALVFYCFDLLCVFPFLGYNCYVYPNGVEMSQFGILVFRCLELLSSGKILRASKDVEAIKAIHLTLGRSIDHLVLPLFVFFVFNVFGAVVLYFMEPCYNYSICAWADLFEASFYSVVSMTTST
jgi:hypothetical protein